MSLATLPDDSCPDHLVDRAQADQTEPFRLLATSVTRNGLFTVGVRANTLFSISDRTEAVGKLSLSDAQFDRISNGRNRWKNIHRIAVMNHSTSILSRVGWVGVTDTEGRAFVTRFPERNVLSARLPPGDFAVGVGLAEGREGSAQVSFFTNRGIYSAWLDGDIESHSFIVPGQTLEISGLRNGISLQPGDHVVYDTANTVSRVRNGRVEILGKIPGEIHSLSGYLYNWRIHLWITTTEGRVFRWKGGTHAGFEALSLRFPDGLFPVAVASGAGLLHPDSPFREDWTEGHFSRTRQTRHGLRLERLLFLTNNGSVFSPWPNARVGSDRPGRLLKMDLSPEFAALAPAITFEREILLKVRSIPVSPVELRLKRELLEEKDLSLKMRDLLLSVWLQRVQRVRYLEMTESGIPGFLNSIGVPRSPASRLVFLDALPSHFADLVLKQRELVPSIVKSLQATHRSLAQTGRSFLAEHSEGTGEARSILLHITNLLGGPVYADIDVILRKLEEQPWNDRPMYQALIHFISEHDPIWDPAWEKQPE